MGTDGTCSSIYFIYMVLNRIRRSQSRNTDKTTYIVMTQFLFFFELKLQRYKARLFVAAIKGAIESSRVEPNTVKVELDPTRKTRVRYSIRKIRLVYTPKG